MDKPTVIEAVRRFLPAYLSTKPVLSRPQRRALWAMQACRTGELGGHVHGCDTCSGEPAHYTYHSCNHKACPLCGRGTTQQWVQRQEEKRIHAPQLIRSPPPAPVTPTGLPIGSLSRACLRRSAYGHLHVTRGTAPPVLW